MANILFRPPCKNMDNDDSKYIRAQMHTNKQEETMKMFGSALKLPLGELWQSLAVIKVSSYILAANSWTSSSLYSNPTTTSADAVENAGTSQVT